MIKLAGSEKKSKIGAKVNNMTDKQKKSLLQVARKVVEAAVRAEPVIW